MAYTTKKYILFGGDYNPNQWDEATLRQDMIYFREAKINTVVLPVFSWAKLEYPGNTDGSTAGMDEQEIS